MARFRVLIEREYTITEGFERTVEAETEDLARVWANEKAREADWDCPDDTSETGGGEARSFSCTAIQRVKEPI